MVLTSEPTDNVTITVSGHANTDATVSPSTLIFTSTNWDMPRTVSVTAALDDIDKGDENEVTLTHALKITAAEYDSVTAEDVVVTLTENDTAGVFIEVIGSGVSAEIDEGDTLHYGMALRSEPTANVTISITSNNADVTVSPTSLSFNDSNWNTYKGVAITAGHDADIIIDDNATITHTVTGTGEYVSITAPSGLIEVFDVRVVATAGGQQVPRRAAQSRGMERAK